MSNSASSVSSSQAIYDALNGSQATSTSKNQDIQNRFLTLLTAQLKNQDPLSPMDNNQMTSQLAQISTLDGIERLNASLQALLNSSTGTQTIQAASMIGHTVLVPGSSMTLAQGLALAGLELGSAADDVKVTIKDANGLAVRTLGLGSLKAGVHGFSWDGKNDAGAQAVDGTYSFSITAKQGQNNVTATQLAVGNVSGVSRSGTDIAVEVTGLGRFGITEVKEIL